MKIQQLLSPSFFTLFLMLLCSFQVSFGQAEPSMLQVEYEANPLGIDVHQPRFSWQMQAADAQRGQRQSAYQIVVTDEAGKTVWDSQKVNSDVSLAIEYAGSALQPGPAITGRSRYGISTARQLLRTPGLRPAC